MVMAITHRAYKYFNPLMTSIPHHIENSQMIFNANQLTGSK